MFVISTKTKFLIRKALKEDLGTGDVTTGAFIPNGLFGEASIIAKSEGVLCGGLVVKEVFRVVDPRLKVVQKVSEGSFLTKGKRVFLIRGRASSILKGERVALNFLGHLSGIATVAHRFAQAVKGTQSKIYDTRKTTPLWRELEKYAVKTGGGKNHRFGLWDEILVKDNHWFAIRSMLEKTHCCYFSQRMQPLLKRRRIPVEVEVASITELKHLLGGDFLPDRILLDNFSVSKLRQAVETVRKKRLKVLLEASGGITLKNVRQVAKTGVGRISVGALTHSAPAFDFSLKLIRCFTS